MERETFSPCFEEYLRLREGEGADIPAPLVAVGKRFLELECQLNEVTFEDVADGLGRETPRTESEVYFANGMPLVGVVVRYCEHGTLIASDPLSESMYGSVQKVVKTARGFLEEARKTAEPSYLISDCPVIGRVVSEAFDVLDQAIISLEGAST